MWYRIKVHLFKIAHQLHMALRNGVFGSSRR